MTTILGLLVSAICWSVLGFLVTLLLLISGGDLHKYQFMAVLSGSMVPTMEVGDLVVAEVVPPHQLRPGDLATFHEPETGRLITHRVQSIIWRGGIADVITRGDANDVGENWAVSADGRVGRAVLVIPRVGYVLGTLGRPAGQVALAGVALVLGVWILVILWRPNRRRYEFEEFTQEPSAEVYEELAEPVPAAAPVG